MEYPTVLGILAAFFGLIGAMAIGLKTFSPEPPPKSGMSRRPRVSFKEYRRAKVAQEERDAVVAQRRTA